MQSIKHLTRIFYAYSVQLSVWLKPECLSNQVRFGNCVKGLNFLISWVIVLLCKSDWLQKPKICHLNWQNGFKFHEYGSKLNVHQRILILMFYVLNSSVKTCPECSTLNQCLWVSSIKPLIDVLYCMVFSPGLPILLVTLFASNFEENLWNHLRRLGLHENDEYHPDFGNTKVALEALVQQRWPNTNIIYSNFYWIEQFKIVTSA